MTARTTLDALPEAKPLAAAAAKRPMSGLLTDSLRGFGVMLGISVVLGGLLAVVAIAWRGLDLYEMSVRAQTVQAQIAMERHKVWLRQVAQMDADAAAAAKVGQAAKPAGGAPAGAATKVLSAEEIRARMAADAAEIHPAP